MSDVEWNIPEFIIATENATYDGLQDAGIFMSGKIQEKVSKKASNKSNKSNGGKPSQPGEPPATDTGTLARSITYQVNDDLTLDVGVASGEPSNNYALTLEFGTRKPIKAKKAKALSWVDKSTDERIFAKSVNIAPRPFLRPALAENYQEADDRFQARVRDSLKDWLL
jgi:HK97 gp10 family phage protein